MSGGWGLGVGVDLDEESGVLFGTVVLYVCSDRVADYLLFR